MRSEKSKIRFLKTSLEPTNKFVVAALHQNKLAMSK
jgi:hypothetical protein